ncbi:hypothetical protein ACFYWU_05485 [Streptomyces chrestomyceticus]|uniref:hypothetical protein n=1 Tax=Streptomyces chrestomyceticus TaxID=68185 RepID=UPI0036B568F5
MTTTPLPPSEMPTQATTGPGSARTAPAPAGRGAPKDAARQGVDSARRPDPRPSAPNSPASPPFVGLHISAPPHPRAWWAPCRWATTPTAAARCSCGGFERHARGAAAVRQLAADWTEHRETACPRVPSETAALAARRREEAEQWAQGRKKRDDRTR